MSALSTQGARAASEYVSIRLGILEMFKEGRRGTGVFRDPFIGFSGAADIDKVEKMPVYGCCEGCHLDLSERVEMPTLVAEAIAVNATKLLLHSSVPRCAACGRLQGEPHAGGCKFAPFTIRRTQ